MSKKQVLKEVEGAILRVCTDIKNKKGGSGAEKLDSLSKLLNSYSRLSERAKKEKHDYEKHGDPDHYKRISRESISKKGIVR